MSLGLTARVKRSLSTNGVLREQALVISAAALLFIDSYDNLFKVYITVLEHTDRNYYNLLKEVIPRKQYLREQLHISRY